jgi:hypothetical protein
VTDPPYGQTNEKYDGKHAASMSSGVWRECARIASQNSCVVAFAGSPTYHRIASAIEDAGWAIRQMWGWAYADGMITSAWPKEGFDRLAPAFDPIVFATRGKVLLNLYSNAFHACGQLGHTERSRSAIVTVSTKNRGDKIEISVSDNGPGIPDSIKDKIFQPFFTTKPTGQGTGLGLSLSYDIIKVHGGEIKLDSKLVKVEENSKQIHKTITLISSCPCVSKRNATWLQDKNQNGGQAPEAIECVYLKDFRK